MPARLLGVKEDTGVPVEVLLLKRVDKDSWETLVRPGRRLKKGVTVSFGDGLLRAEIGDTTSAGGRIVTFLYEGVFEELLDRLGETLEPVYGFRSLLAFKAKFQPRYVPLYMTYRDPASLPAIGNAVARAYLPKMSLAQGFTLVRTIVDGSR